MPLCSVRSIAAAAVTLCLAPAITAHAAPPKHLFLIMMENHSTEDIIGNTEDAPFLNDLLKQTGVRYATQYFGVTHPSMPNYLALLSGSTQGVFDDCRAGADVTCPPAAFVPEADAPAISGHLLTEDQANSASGQPHMFDAPTLVDGLESAGLSWKAYMEDIRPDAKTDEYAPVGSDGKVVAKLYAQKHNPFMYFSTVRDNPARMERIVPYDALARDLAAGTAPTFAWITPNQCHDMHGISPASAEKVHIPDCAYVRTGLDHKVIRLGDAWLSDTVATIRNSPAWAEGAVILIVWDEDDYTGFGGLDGSPIGRNGVLLGGSRTPLIVVTHSDVAPLKIDVPFNHYYTLRAIQDLFDLDCLELSCDIEHSERIVGLLD